jgi:hypothetical protein
MDKMVNFILNSMILFSLFASCYSSVVLKACDYDTRDSCLNHWPCMWCNTTDVDLMIGINESYCKTVSPCDFNQTKLPMCEFKNAKKYNLECKLLAIFFWIMIFIGYYISMIVIYGTVNRMLIAEDVTEGTRANINAIVLVLTSVPLFVFFFYDLTIFLFIFVIYISLGFSTYCCIKVKDADSMKEIDLNIVGQKEKTAYTSIQ